MSSIHHFCTRSHAEPPRLNSETSAATSQTLHYRIIKDSTASSVHKYPRGGAGGQTAPPPCPQSRRQPCSS
jgi:hypothetical protein